MRKKKKKRNIYLIKCPKCWEGQFFVEGETFFEAKQEYDKYICRECNHEIKIFTDNVIKNKLPAE